MSTERIIIIIIGDKDTFLFDAYHKAFIEEQQNLIFTGGRSFGRSNLQRRLIEPHEKPSKSIISSLKNFNCAVRRIKEAYEEEKTKHLYNEVDKLNNFNHAKHLATCAKNRKKRKSKKRNKNK